MASGKTPKFHKSAASIFSVGHFDDFSTIASDPITIRNPISLNIESKMH